SRFRFRLRRDAAKLFVIYQLFDRWIIAAHRTIGILAQLQFTEAHAPRVEEQQPVHHDVRCTENNLDRFVRLNRADDSGQHSQHTTFGTRWNQARRRRLRIEAAVAGPAFGPEHARLSFKTKDRAVNVGLPGEHTSIVDEITRRKIIGAVDDYVVIHKQPQRVLARHSGLMRFDLDVRIDVLDAISRGGYL